MISAFDIGDTILLKGEIVKIEQIPDGKVLYYIREYDLPIKESSIIAKVQDNWHLQKNTDN